MSASRHRTGARIASDWVLVSCAGGSGGFDLRDYASCTFSQVELEELRNLYGAGNQLVKVLRKLAKVAEDDELQQPFEKGPNM
jgi:Domain of unknown function (DUF892)